MAEKLITVENLSVSFDGKTVLHDASFDIDKGDVVAIIGPNGSGKTLLIKSILGLQEHTGQVIWHSQPETSYVPQKMGFEKGFPLTVKEFFLLETGGRDSFWLPSAQKEKEIEERLKEVGLGHLLNSRLGDMSQGEAQRMLIARSLLENPEIIFFDEPAAGVDISAEETVYKILHNIHQKTNMTMVIISHELSVVYNFATKVICLNRDLICQGAPAEVLTPENLQKLYGHHTAFHNHNHNDDNQQVDVKPEIQTSAEPPQTITDQHDHI